jgi:hypothetical protein
MALAMNLCVWHVWIYMYFYVFALSKTAKLQIKKKSGQPIRRGQCRRRRGCHMPMVEAMPRVRPSAYSPSYAEGEAVGVCPIWREAELMPCAPIRRGGGRRRMLAREALGKWHVHLYAEGNAVGVGTTPSALLRPSEVLRRRSIRRGPPSSRRHYSHTPRARLTPTVMRVLPREVYADELRRELPSA